MDKRDLELAHVFFEKYDFFQIFFQKKNWEEEH